MSVERTSYAPLHRGKEIEIVLQPSTVLILNLSFRHWGLVVEGNVRIVARRLHPTTALS